MYRFQEMEKQLDKVRSGFDDLQTLADKVAAKYERSARITDSRNSEQLMLLQVAQI